MQLGRLTLVMSSPQPIEAVIVDGPVPRWTAPAFGGGGGCRWPVVVGLGVPGIEASPRVSGCVAALWATAVRGLCAPALTVPLAVAQRTYFPSRVPFDQAYIKVLSD